MSNSMDLISISKIISDEKLSFKYLLNKINVSCPYCNDKRFANGKVYINGIELSIY